MKKLLLLINLLIAVSTFAQEGTKQFMPNAGDKLFIEFNAFNGGNFGTYDCAENERINIFLNAGEKMFFGMKMNEINYGGNVYINPEHRSFRVREPDGDIAYASTTMRTEGENGYINNYTEAVTGPNGVELNGTVITNGYTPISFEATKTGNYYIEFQSWNSNHAENGDNTGNTRRFALEFFDVTVTDGDNNIITNPGEPNKSAGRLWSYGWQLTNTSFTENPVNAHFFVFTSDEFINKVNFKMYPFSFVFVANRYGITPYSEQNYIRRVQSREGDQVSGNDLSEYKIFLNDPDRIVWPNTRLAPPTVRVKAENNLYMDYQYNRNPTYNETDRDTLVIEKNTDNDCDHEDVTFFNIETNIDGYTAILIDLDGDGTYSASGSDRVIYRDLKKGLNYILWDFKTDAGAVVNNNNYNASATFLGRGPAHFPMYDVEQMDGITTSSIRPFNRLNTTMYWDDSQIDIWGDLDNLGRMDETKKKQLKISENTPRTWTYHGDTHEKISHNGEQNTLNTWFNAIDLGYNDIVLKVSKSETKCLNGSAPWVGDVYKEGPKNSTLVFSAENFDFKFSHPLNEAFQTIRITSLPDIGQLTYQGNPATIDQEISRENIPHLTYSPPNNWVGKTPFSWAASDGSLWSNNEEAVYCIINTAPVISEIDDQVLCTNSETQPIDFTVDDADTSSEDLTITGFSANPSVVPHSGINIQGTGSNRTVTITPVPYESGHAIIYLMVDDDLSQTIEEFAVTIAPSLQFSGDTSLCLDDPLYLIAEEFGAESYSWNFEGSTISEDRMLQQPEGDVNYGEWSLSIEKYIEIHDITCTSTRNFTVDYSPNTTFSGDRNVCVGEQISLVPDEVNATFEWRNAGEAITTDRTFSKEASLDDNLDDYTLWVNKSGCEYESDPFSISVLILPGTSMTVEPGQVDPGRAGDFTITNADQDFIYRAYCEGIEIASATASSTEVPLTIPATYLEIGENSFELTVDNGNCEVTLDNPGIIIVNQPGITVSPLSVETSEDGEPQTFSVVLNTAPLNGVTINLSSSDESEGTISHETLYFDAGNWDSQQIVAITPVRDYEDEDDNSVEYSIILSPVESDDHYYAGIDPDDVTVTNLDADEAGIEASPTELTTSENGSSATFTVAFNSKPLENVRISFTGIDESEGSLDLYEIVFTPDNWDQTQSITVTGVDDDIDDDWQDYTLTGTVISDDSKYDDMSFSNIIINNEDNDDAGLTISPSSITTYEDQSQPSAIFEMALNSQPLSNVTVTIASSNPDEGFVTSSSLTFNNSNWNTDQTVTINGVDNNMADGDTDYLINIETSSSDNSYNELNSSVSAQNIDNDVAGIITSVSSIETSEDRTEATFSVHLQSEPLSTTTIEIVSSDNESEEGAISHQELVFNSSNWNADQTVTITGVDDHIIDGDRNYNITLTVTAGDTDYTSLNDITIAATNLDNDVAQIWASDLNLETSENLTSDSFELRLTAQPESDVDIEITGLDESEGSLSNASLLFTPANWNVSQLVTVTGVNDEIADGNITYFLTATSSSSYAHYNNVASEGVEVTNLDNNSAGINVSPATINLSEGQSASFIISINSRPTENVTINLSSSDDNEVTISTNSVTFTPADWTSKTINVIAANDDIDDGDQNHTISLSNAVSADSNYDGMSVNDVTVNVTDIHTAGLSISEVSGNTSEAGGTSTFTIVPESKPTADIIVSTSSLDTSEGRITGSGTLTFTPLNWNTPQTITIEGVDDLNDDGDQVYEIAIEISGTDANYGESLNTSVSLINEDNDTAGLTITEEDPFMTTEDGGTATFTVVLNSEPTDEVFISSVSNLVSEGEVTSGNSLTFDATNWSVPQTVTITGSDDNIDDGDQEYRIDLEVSSSDNNYGNSMNTSLALFNEDNDNAGFTIDPVTGENNRIETTEDGGIATFSIKLNSQPTHNVTINSTSNDLSEGAVTASSSSISFSSTDWDTPKTIPIRGANDDMADGDKDYTVSIAANSDDINYHQISIDDIYLQNIDNDETGLVLSKKNIETAEPNGSDNLFVKLKSEPLGDVIITIVSSNENEGVASPSSLTFNADNWNSNQEVIITGQDDNVMDGDTHYNITITVSSDADLQYDDLAEYVLSAVNTDNNFAGITVDPVAGLYTSEAGTTASFSVELTSKPTNQVSISLLSDDITEGLITAVSRGSADANANTATITFEPDEWNNPVVVTVTGVDDDVNDSDKAYTIECNNAESDDPDYDNENVSNISITNQDDDSYGTIVTPGSLSIDENGEAQNFTIVLESRPTAEVTYNLTTSYQERVSVSPLTVSFTPTGDDWMTPKEITVNPIDNHFDDGDIEFSIISGKGVTDDPNYTNHSPASVTVSIVNDDRASIDISEPSGPTSEDGGEATFTIGLRSAPVDQVLFEMSSTDTSEGKITNISNGRGSIEEENKAFITYDHTNWSEPVTITITGQQDDLADGNQIYHIEFEPIIGGTSKYTGVRPDPVEMVNRDNNTAGYTINPNNGLEISEAGKSTDFKISLNSMPDGNVIINLSSEMPDEGIISAITQDRGSVNESGNSASVNFTPENWNIPVTVTLTGVDDNEQDGNQTFNIILDCNDSETEDENYKTEISDVSVTNLDDFIPRPINDMAVTDQENPVTTDVLANDDGLDYGASITLATEPERGEAILNQDNTITYNPDRLYYGEFAFEYTVTNSLDNTANALVTVNVEHIDVTPIANDDYRGTSINTPVEVDVLRNDENLYDSPILVTIVGTSNTDGEMIVTEQNTIIFTPSPDFTGSATFHYRVTDNEGDSDEAIATINVREENHIPLATDDEVIIYKNTAEDINVLDNDSGLDDGLATFDIFAQPTNGTATINPNRTIHYIPDTDFTGNDLLVYLLEDVDGDYDLGIVNIEVVDIPDAVPAANDVAAATEFETPVNINILFNDTGLEDGVAGITLSPEPTNGTAQVNDDFTVTYNPGSGFSGTESFGYQVCDNNGDCSSASIRVTVMPEGTENHIPTAADDEATTYLNTPVTIDILANDTGLEDGIGDIIIPVPPRSGSVLINDNHTITFDPGYLFVGQVSFSYLVSDEDGDWDTAMVTVDVIEEENIVPEAIDDEASVTENNSVNIDVLANDLGLDDMPVVVSINLEAGNGLLLVESDQTFTYTPDEDFIGNDSFRYSVTDANGDSDVATVAVTVEADPNNDDGDDNGGDDSDEDDETGNNHPVANNDEAVTFKNTTVNIDVLSNDTGMEDQPISLTVSKSANDGNTVVEEDHTITFTPPGDYVGQISFGYEITDSNGDKSEATVTVDILPGITAINDTIKSEMNQTINIHPLNNDEGIESDVFVTILQHPVNGNSSIDDSGNITYDPQFNFVGTDSISYEVCSEENINNCSSALVIILINEPENQTVDEFSIPEGFSPDGDGVNDYFEIRGIEKYERITISIFNRWGNLVYKSNDYRNNWDGTSRKTLGSSGSLPTGTYFYVIKIVDNDKQYKGNVFLKK